MKTVDNFILTKVIGGGAYGVVYVCEIKNKNNMEPETKKRMRAGRKVACKMINQKNVKARIKKYLVQEIEVMMSITHDNILRFLEAKKTTNNIYIFFEYWNGGDLRKFVDFHDGKLNEKLCKVILRQLAEGLNHLNEKKTMHRDLKLDNILLNFPDYPDDGPVSEDYLANFDYTKDRIEVIIGDLGFARSLDAGLAESYWGTPLNMAPEIMNGEYYDTKVDIWSFGTIMYELLVGFTPFTGQDPSDLANNVNVGQYGVPKNIKLSLQWLDLLNRCLQYNSKKRINHSDILKHPFMEEEEDADKISLSTSVGPDQRSFFEPPESCEDINEKNAHILSIKDSCLFNDTYQKTLQRFVEKQNNAQRVEEIKEVEEDDEDHPGKLPDVMHEEGEHDEESSKEGEEIKASADKNANNQPNIEVKPDVQKLMEAPQNDTKIREEEAKGNKENPNELEDGTEMNANQPVAPIKGRRSRRDRGPDHIQNEESNKIEINRVSSVKKDDINNDKELISNKAPQINSSNNLVAKLNEVSIEEMTEEPKPAEEDKEDEEDEETKMFGEYSIIDIKSEFPEGFKSKFEPIQEVDETDLTESKNTDGGCENPDKPSPNNETEDLNSSFEIVHYHDIKLIEHGYLTRETVAL